MDGKHSQHPEPLFTLGSFVPLTNGTTSPKCHCGVSIVPMVLQALLMKRCTSKNAKKSKVTPKKRMLQRKKKLKDLVLKRLEINKRRKNKKGEQWS